MSIEKILVIDDEEIVRDFLSETLKRKGLEVSVASCGDAGLKLLKESNYDMVITDLKMPDISGIDVLKKTKKFAPNTLVVVITAHGSIENAVQAMKLGANNYLLKPFSPDTIEAVIDKANEHVSLLEENQYLRKQVSLCEADHNSIVAVSSEMKKIIESAKRIALSDANVFITGESGTGKEVISHLIHYNSERNKAPYIKVNCAAMPETLIESEFFGHEKGSFTGANAKRIGRFELANKGTLLLDEITEIPLALQAKLLRAIQEKNFERVGGTKPINVDVRLISTSNRDIQDAISHNIFREDLYYRLNVVPLHIPALRDRKDDIIPLAESFLRKKSRHTHTELTNSAKEKLLEYSWPGNVRELFNIMERAIVLSPKPKIDPDDLYINGGSTNSTNNGNQVPVGLSLSEIEKKMIIETLEANKGNRTKTAEILGITTRTLRNKIKQYEMD